MYLFTRSGTTWAQTAFIKASNTGPRDGFGEFVALDGNTLAVAAMGEGSSATGVNGDQDNDDAESAGAVYIRRIGR